MRRISTKIIAVLVGLSLVFGVSIVFNIRQVGMIQEKSEEIAKGQVPNVYLVNEFRSAYQEKETLLYEMMMTEKEDQIQELTKQIEELDVELAEGMESLKEAFTDEAGSKVVGHIELNMASYNKIYKRVQKKSSGDSGSQAAFRTATSKLVEFDALVKNDLDELDGLITGNMDAAVEDRIGNSGSLSDDSSLHHYLFDCCRSLCVLCDTQCGNANQKCNQAVGKHYWENPERGRRFDHSGGNQLQRRDRADGAWN